MELYNVKKGKHYFKGDKTQSSLLLYILAILGIGVGALLNSWTVIFCCTLIFLSCITLVQDIHKSTSMRAYFYPSCLYQLSTNFDQVNKLFGISEGFHHWNSARIGWRCLDGEEIEILAYAYVNGKRIIKPMIKCKAQEWVFLHIENKRSKYVFKALTPNSQSITISIDKITKITVYSLFKLFMYKLYPYFGGKQSAPHDMSLYLVKLKTES